MELTEGCEREELMLDCASGELSGQDLDAQWTSLGMDDKDLVSGLKTLMSNRCQDRNDEVVKAFRTGQDANTATLIEHVRRCLGSCPHTDAVVEYNFSQLGSTGTAEQSKESVDQDMQYRANIGYGEKVELREFTSGWKQYSPKTDEVPAQHELAIEMLAKRIENSEDDDDSPSLRFFSGHRTKTDSAVAKRVIDRISKNIVTVDDEY